MRSTKAHSRAQNATKATRPASTTAAVATTSNTRCLDRAPTPRRPARLSASLSVLLGLLPASVNGFLANGNGVSERGPRLRFRACHRRTRPFGLSGKISVAGKLRTIPSAPQLRPGSRNSRCRAFGVGMGSPQGVQKRQSPVFPAPGRVFLKEIGMFAAFISLLGSLAQAHFVWNGDIVLNVAMSGGGVDWPWICILAAILGVVWVIASRKR